MPLIQYSIFQTNRRRVAVAAKKLAEHYGAKRGSLSNERYVITHQKACVPIQPATATMRDKVEPTPLPKPIDPRRKVESNWLKPGSSPRETKPDPKKFAHTSGKVSRLVEPKTSISK
jgi:hypothetical protein